MHSLHPQSLPRPRAFKSLPSPSPLWLKYPQRTISVVPLAFKPLYVQVILEPGPGPIDDILLLPKATLEERATYFTSILSGRLGEAAGWGQDDRDLGVLAGVWPQGKSLVTIITDE